MISPLLWSLAATVLVLQAAVFSTTIYMHRAVTHRALTLHPIVAWAFRLTLWLTTGMVAKKWAAVHRKHHAFTEEDGDPHSPYIQGFWHVQLGTIFYYVKETRNRETVRQYARDIKDDVWDRYFFNHGVVGPVLGLLLLCGALGLWWGLLTAALHGVIYVFVLNSSINGLCHRVGYKNFDNTATNIRIIALMTAGEGLHNNHHGFPSSPKLSVKSSEIIRPGPIIRLLTIFGLAQPQKTIKESLSFAKLPTHASE